MRASRRSWHNFRPSKVYWLAKLLCIFVPQAFCSINFFAHVAFAGIESTSSYPHKEFLIPRPPRTHTYNSVGSHTRPANAGTRNTRGLTRPTQDSSGNAQHLKSRHRFVPAAQPISSYDDDNNRSAALWVDYRWNEEWLENTARLCTFIPHIGTHPTGMVRPIATAGIRGECPQFVLWPEKYVLNI